MSFTFVNFGDIVDTNHMNKPTSEIFITDTGHPQRTTGSAVVSVSGTNDL